MKIGSLALLAGMLFWSQALYAAPKSGIAHFVLKGEINATFDLTVKNCTVTRPGDSFMNGLILNFDQNEMVAVGTFQVPAYSGDRAYIRTPSADKTVRFSFQIHKNSKDRKFYELDLRDKAPGTVKVSVRNRGSVGSAQLTDIALTKYGSPQGKVSGSIDWTCQSVQNL